MFGTVLVIMLVLFAIYVYVNEQIKKKNKIPFSTRLNEVEKKRNISKGRL